MTTRSTKAGPRRLVAVLLLALLAVSTPPAADAGPVAAGICGGDVPRPASDPDAPPLRFGATVAGRVFAPHPATVDREAHLDAARRLAPGRPFVARVNRVLFSEGDAAIAAAAARARTWSDAGFLVDFQLRYDAPSDQSQAFVAWVDRLVRTVGTDPNVVSVQVTNEANLRAPDNSDGGRDGLFAALTGGVVAADAAARDIGRGDDIAVGFSWYYQVDHRDRLFWSSLQAAAAAEAGFLPALDWVGLSAYPGTYFPAAAPPGTEGALMVDALGTLRCSMRRVGIADTVGIRVSENGWPSDVARSEVLQARALEDMVRAVDAHRGAYNVTDYSWFTLWDANDDGLDKSTHFGVLREDGSPKPAFDVYRGLIADLGRAA